MLVIRRHPGETILIGGEIELEVIECGHNRVKLGIRAPQHIPVMRGEVMLTRDQNISAAQSMAGGAIPAVLGRPAPGGAVVPLLGETPGKRTA
ncbi:Carbon storage regulator (modular protein) [Candidatus Sulfopaludibacter sp. SbA4]|nr:Carbon storage regulator (modular protein) [Candidatus Sulfopaludibacter sp. SbA4]